MTSSNIQYSMVSVRTVLYFTYRMSATDYYYCIVLQTFKGSFQLSRRLFWSRQPPGCRAHQVELRQYPAQPQPLGMYVPSAFNFHCDTLHVTSYIPPIRFRCMPARQSQVPKYQKSQVPLASKTRGPKFGTYVPIGFTRRHIMQSEHNQGTRTLSVHQHR